MDPALVKLREWIQVADTCFKMTTNPWTGGVHPERIGRRWGTQRAPTSTPTARVATSGRALLRARPAEISLCSSARPLCRSTRAAWALLFCWRKPRLQV
jgi:hypothetical protein